MEQTAPQKEMQKTLKISAKQANEIKVSKQIAETLKRQWEDLAKRQQNSGIKMRADRRITSVTFKKDENGKIAVQENMYGGQTIKDNGQEKALDRFKEQTRLSYVHARVAEFLRKIREYGYAAVEGEIPPELKEAVLKGMEKANISTSYKGRAAEAAEARQTLQNAAKAADNAAKTIMPETKGANLAGALAAASGLIGFHKDTSGQYICRNEKGQEFSGYDPNDLIINGTYIGSAYRPEEHSSFKQRKGSNSIETIYTNSTGDKVKVNGSSPDVSKVKLDEAEALFSKLEKGEQLSPEEEQRVAEWKNKGINSLEDFKPGKDGRSKATKIAEQISNNVTSDFKKRLDEAQRCNQERLTKKARTDLSEKLDLLEYIVELKEKGQTLTREQENLYQFGLKTLTRRNPDGTREDIHAAIARSRKEIETKTYSSALTEFGKAKRPFLKDGEGNLYSREQLALGNIPPTQIVSLNTKPGKSISDLTEQSRDNRKNGVEDKEDKLLMQYLDAVTKIYGADQITLETLEIAERLKQNKVNLGQLHSIAKKDKLTLEQKLKETEELEKEARNKQLQSPVKESTVSKQKSKQPAEVEAGRVSEKLQENMKETPEQEKEKQAKQKEEKSAKGKEAKPKKSLQAQIKNAEAKQQTDSKDKSAALSDREKAAQAKIIAMKRKQDLAR